MKQRWPIILFCVVVAYLAFFYKLGHPAFLGADEARYARVAEEMNLRGDYVTPTLNFQPWLEKPPFLFWLEAASFQLFGVSEWSARLPVAILALLGAAIAALLAFDAGGPRPALLTFLILCTSGLYAIFGRAASTDMPLVVTLTGALVFGFKSLRQKSWIWSALSGVCLGGAVLAKGPVALVLYMGIFALFFLLTWSFPARLGHVAAGSLTFSVTSIPWYWQIWQAEGYDFISTFFINHHLARFITDIHHHSQPIWYYLPVLLIGFFPWIFFLGSSVKRTWKQRRRLRDGIGQTEIFLWIWVATPLIFFSIGESKLPGYILPIFPALAILAGLEWDRYFDRELLVYRFIKVELAVLAAFGILLSLSILLGFHFFYESPVTGLLMSSPLVVAIVLGHYEFRRKRPIPLFLVLVAGMTLTLALTYWRGAPVVEDYHSTRDLSRTARPLISEKRPLILYRYFHHTAGYYTDYQTLPEPLNDLEELRNYLKDQPQERYVLLTQKQGWEDLESLSGTRLIRHEGNLYLVELERLAGSEQEG